MQKPIILITQGDPAGIGPEVVLKALAEPRVYQMCLPVVVGDGLALRAALGVVKQPLALREITCPAQALGRPGRVDFIDLHLLGDDFPGVGRVSAQGGHAAFCYVKKAVELALGGQAQAIATAPINKEALNLAGHPFAGHTEICAHLTGCGDYAMVLTSGGLRVVHVSTHVALREACLCATPARVLRTILLAQEALELMGTPGKIAVAGLNPHCSEGGLFGNEEAGAIIPAIEEALRRGVDVEGPIPPDTVFVKAWAGVYAGVVAMYHDQGHIPVKMAGFRMDGKTGKMEQVGGVNWTVGLPIIRTSVDHGTAFDVAGKGIAQAQSMADAIEMAVTIARNSVSP